MTQNNTRKKALATRTSQPKVTAAALIAAATAETVRHNTKLNPAWLPAGDTEMSPLPALGQYEIKAHDDTEVAPAMTEEQGEPLEPVWDLDRDLRRGAVPIYRRALAGVIGLADRGMRLAGWRQTVRDTEGTHHAGATWSKGGESVSLQLLATHALPWKLLERRKPVTAAERAAGSVPPFWREGGTRMLAVIRPHNPAQIAGYERLSESLAAAVWRAGDNPGSAPARCDGIAIREVVAEEIRWSGALPRIYFRRDNEEGLLPRAIRTTLAELRGKVLYYEVSQERLDKVELPMGTMLRPEGIWTSFPFGQMHGDMSCPPDLEPGQVLLAYPRPSLSVDGNQTERLESGDIFPSATLARIHRPGHFLARYRMEEAIRNSVRWQMEGIDG